MRKNISGVTMLELMIVVAIIGLLSAIAVPSYRQYSVRAHRVDAQIQLLKIAAAQEKFYLQNNQYCPDADMDKDLPDGLGILHYSELGYYQFKMEDGMSDYAVNFVASAVAVGGQLDNDAGCKSFSINQKGVKYGGPGPISSPSTSDPKCWGK